MKDLKIITGAIGIGEIAPDIVHVSIPVLEKVTERKRTNVVGSPWLVTNKKDFWPINEEEQDSREICVKSVPVFGQTESRWWWPDIQRHVRWTRVYDVDPKGDVFDKIREELDNHIDFYDSRYLDVVACWVIGTYLFSAFSAFPYLFISGPRGSGKTKVLDVLNHIVFNPESTSSITPSSMFRLIEANKCTLLIDEAEMLRQGEHSQELKLILNAGYKPGKPVVRTNADKEMRVEKFDVYSPKALASINKVDSTLISRGIEISMIKTSNKSMGNRRVTESSGSWTTIRCHLYRFLMNHSLKVKEIYESSEAINRLQCRKNELWSPLLAIALYIDKGLFERMVVIAEGDNKEEDTNIDPWNAALLRGLKDLVKAHIPYLVNNIKNAMLVYLEVDERDRVSSRWVGQALKGFAFKKGSRQSTGNTYVIDPKQVEDLINRYQLNEHSELSEGEKEGEDEFLKEIEHTFLN